MAEDTPTAQSDWITGAVDTIVSNVDKVRESGTENVVKVVRGIVYGLVAMVFALAALIMIIVVLVRLADAYLPIGAGVGDATWAAHLFIGVLLSVLGLGLWLNRKKEGFRWVLIAGVLDLLIVAAVICYGIIDAVR